jgi:2-polyprenyl-3-methyl-5-hydroxy-6-metoxy-1,4-benzoquinol methylase
MRKYYEAYEERYKVIHETGELWFTALPSQEVVDWVKRKNISFEESICEVGCGEGRDAINLALKGFQVTGVDISEQALKKCREIASEKGAKVTWLQANATIEISKKYDWVYSMATLHMLVEDHDRQAFLNSLYKMLSKKGHLLLVTKGDGKFEMKTDIKTAFDLQERTHMKTGTALQVAGTSYRAMNWKNHLMELDQAGFTVEHYEVTDNPDYGECMAVYLRRNDHE